MQFYLPCVCAKRGDAEKRKKKGVRLPILSKGVLLLRSNAILETAQIFARREEDRSAPRRVIIMRACRKITVPRREVKAETCDRHHTRGFSTGEIIVNANLCFYISCYPQMKI